VLTLLISFLILLSCRIDTFKPSIVANIFIVPSVLLTAVLMISSFSIKTLFESDFLQENMAYIQYFLWARIQILLMLYVFLFCGILKPLCLSTLKKGTIVKGWTEKEKNWIILILILLLVFIFSYTSIQQSLSSTSKLLEDSSKVLRMFVMAGLRYSLVGILALIMYAALPSGIKKLAFDRIPNVVGVLFISLGAYIFVIMLMMIIFSLPLFWMATSSLRSMGPILVLLGLLGFIFWVLCFIDCFKLVRPKVLLIWFGVIGFFALIAYVSMTQELFSYYSSFERSLIGIFCFSAILGSVVNLWMMAGSIQLGLCWMYRKAGADVSAEGGVFDRFNHSFFTKLFFFIK